MEYCTECPYTQDAPGVKPRPVEGSGAEDAKVVFVCPSPEQADTTKGEFFSGKVRDIIHSCLDRSKLDISDVRFEGVLSCQLPGGRSPRPEEHKCCSKGLLNRINEIGPKVVIPFGYGALQVIEGGGGIKSRAGLPRQMPKYVSIPTSHTSWFTHQSLKEQDNLVDVFNMAYDYAYDYPDQPEREYTIINTKSMLREKIEMLREEDYSKLAFDIETQDLSLNTTLLGVGFCYAPGKAFYIPLFVSRQLRRRVVSLNKKKAKPSYKVELSPFWGEHQDEIDDMIGDILCSGDFKLSTHQGRFDILRVRMQKGEKWNFTSNWVFDTYMGIYLLDENRPGGKGLGGTRHLGALATRYPDLLGFKDETAGAKDFSQIPTETLARRCMADCDATFRETERLAPLIMEGGFEFMLWEYMLPVQSMLTDMQISGLYIDTGHQNALDTKLAGQAKDLLGQIHKAAKRKFNPNSDPELAKVLFDELKVGTATIFTPVEKIPSSSKAHLKQFKDKHPIINLLLELARVEKLHSTFVLGYKKFTLPSGRMHPTFNIAYATITGRLSASDPNVQNPDNKGDIRKQISARPGWGLVQGDVSQAEPRWSADLSKDPLLLESFAAGRDFHSNNIAETTKMSYEEVQRLHESGDPKMKQIRKDAKKSVSFGVFYGMYYTTLAKQIKQSTETIAQAQVRAKAFIATWFKKFKRTKQFRDEVHAEINETGEIRAAYGQVRRLPGGMSTNAEERSEAERQGFNFIHQNPSSIMTLMYMKQAWDIMKERGLAWEHVVPVNTIHDSMFFETRYQYMLEVGEIITEVVKELPSFGHHTTAEVVIKIDVEYDKPWTVSMVAHISSGLEGVPACGSDREDLWVLSEFDSRVPERCWCLDCMEAE